MDRSAYQTAQWRQLPRTDCLVSVLLEDAAGECAGPIHRHHVDPRNPNSRTVPVCQLHHARVHSVLYRLRHPVEPRRCPHQHRYEWARRECERRLNEARPA